MARDEDDEGLLALVNELRDDVQQWPHLWAPAAAIAAARSAGSSRLGGLDLLRDAVAGGFAQLELFDGLIEDHFAALPEWEGLRRRMHENVPPAPLEILAWPDPPAALPLLLDRLGGERADLLRGQLPNPSGSAWETAKALLAWVHRRWDHANDHVDDPDAVDVLTRVDAGERFACVEYSIVLSQALNALEIPARRVSLRQANHHTGMGRGHVVSEAWVDDLGRWVLLDGQNGAYWVDDDGDPLGLVDLQAAYACGDGPATFVGPAGTKSVRGCTAVVELLRQCVDDRLCLDVRSVLTDLPRLGRHSDRPVAALPGVGLRRCRRGGSRRRRDDRVAGGHFQHRPSLRGRFRGHPERSRR